MAATSKKPELLVIVGPTASGKSKLAMKLAKEFSGEIIAADSRTIYKGMDIGTAKPSDQDQETVKHWGIDLIEPGEIYSASQFKQYAERKIKEIESRNKLPVVVGGTGLYIDALIFNYIFPKKAVSRLENPEMLSVKDLQQTILDNSYKMPENSKNKRHLIRTIEREGLEGKKSERPLEGSLLIGLKPSDSQLKKRIDKRADEIFNNGVIEETRRLLKNHPRQNIVKNGGIVYKICIKVIDGTFELQEAKELFKSLDWQYARRQKTWFRRNKYIQWFDTPDKAYKVIIERLNN